MQCTYSHGHMCINVENFCVNNLQCQKFFMRLIFVGQGYPQKLFNLEHFPIYDTYDYTCVYILQ